MQFKFSFITCRRGKFHHASLTKERYGCPTAGRLSRPGDSRSRWSAAAQRRFTNTAIKAALSLYLRFILNTCRYSSNYSSRHIYVFPLW